MKTTMLAVAGIMIGLYAVDKALANLEEREVTAQAAGFYADGQKLLSAGKAAAAVDDFRRAHTLARTNRSFDQALAGAQLTAGRPADAEATLADILSSNTNDSRANLLMARVRLVEGRFDDGVAFYHRAIYGTWTDGSEADKTNARLELAEQLAKRGRSEELLSELLLLDNEAQKNPQLSKKVAALYLDAGAAQRAAAAYRQLVKADPKDAEAYEGLGEAELRLGDYRAAHSAFTAAQRDPALVQLADRLAEIDPTSRRLASAEKFRRSQEILRLAENAAMDCLKGGTPPDGLRDLLTAAEKMRSERVGAMPSNEAAEARLALAEQIWKERDPSCAIAPDDPLSIIIRKIGN
jgi:tetratricopeptide (TPR) repeat protein